MDERLTDILDDIYRKAHGLLRPPTEEERRAAEQRRREAEEDRLVHGPRRIREARERGARYAALRRSLREEMMARLRHGHRADERTVGKLREAFERLGVPAAKADVLADAAAAHYATGDAAAAWRLADETAGELVAAGWEPPEPEEEPDPRALAALIPRLGRP